MNTMPYSELEVKVLFDKINSGSNGEENIRDYLKRFNRTPLAVYDKLKRLNIKKPKNGLKKR